MLVVLGLFKLAALIDRGLRLRTACDLEPVERDVVASRPVGFRLPGVRDLGTELKAAIASVRDRMTPRTFAYEDKLKQGKDDDEDGGAGADEAP